MTRNQQLSRIASVRTVNSDDQANELLEQGWQLLSVSGSDDRVAFVVGKPKITAVEKELAKYNDNDFAS